MELGTPPIPPPTTPGGGGSGPFPDAGMFRAMSSSRRSLMHSPSNLGRGDGLVIETMVGEGRLTRCAFLRVVIRVRIDFV